MTIALVITALYVGLAYLVFVRFKWLKFSITWGVIVRSPECTSSSCS
jgi:hypothetical protein